MLGRLIALVLRSGLWPRVRPLGPSITPFRVLPGDLDLLGHMNNGVYFSIFDLARTDLMLRSGLMSKMRERGWYAVVKAETASFRSSLKPFRRFDVETRVLGWDERHLYLQHRVLSGGRVATSAVIQARFLGRGGERIAPEQLLDLLPAPVERPELPDWVADWSKSAHDHATSSE